MSGCEGLKGTSTSVMPSSTGSAPPFSGITARRNDLVRSTKLMPLEVMLEDMPASTFHVPEYASYGFRTSWKPSSSNLSREGSASALRVPDMKTRRVPAGG